MKEPSPLLLYLGVEEAARACIVGRRVLFVYVIQQKQKHKQQITLCSPTEPATARATPKKPAKLVLPIMTTDLSAGQERDKRDSEKEKEIF